jgi:hypothetical protein
VPGLGHELEQAGAGFAEVGQAAVMEFVQIPAGAGPSVAVVASSRSRAWS